MASTLPTRHLSVVTDNTTARHQLAQAVSGLETALRPPAIPAAVLEELEDLDTAAAAADDIYDIRTRELDAARDALADAREALAEAEGREGRRSTAGEHRHFPPVSVYRNISASTLAFRRAIRKMLN